MDQNRVIVHIDLDCFYCQVEQKRLSIDRNIPCAVQQWNGLIAVNYAARSAGVTRFMRVLEAREKCPELRLLHVETIGKGGRSGDSIVVPYNAKNTHKASLDRYRQASAEIIQLIKDQVPDSELEKASIDEVYLDLTSLATKELEMASIRGDVQSRGHALERSILVGGPVDDFNDKHNMLIAGAAITLRIREALLSTLDYTCSAGIAQNKQLAKLTSAMNKPNKQTIVLENGIPLIMTSLPLKKIPMFGGKLGTLLEQELDCQTAGDIQNIQFHVLAQLLGNEKAEWVSKAARGIWEEQVKPKKRSKSMTSAKSFYGTKDTGKLEEWIEILAVDLADRISKEMIIHNRIPRSLTLSWQCGRSDRRSKVCPAPKFGMDGLAVQDLNAAGKAGLVQIQMTQECSWLALTFSNFTEKPKQGQQSILSYLTEGNGNEVDTECLHDGHKEAEGVEDKEHYDLSDIDIEDQRRILQIIKLKFRNRDMKRKRLKMKSKQKRPTVYELLCKGQK